MQPARLDRADAVAVGVVGEPPRRPRAAVVRREPVLDLVPAADRARQVDVARILVVERRAARVERGTACARLHDPAADPLGPVVVRVVEGVAVGDPSRVDDPRPALGRERDVVPPRPPAAVGVRVDVVELGGVQRHRSQAPQPAPARGVEVVRLVAQVVEAVLPVLRVALGEDAVDPPVAVPDVLRVGPLRVAEVHELAGRHPVAAVLRVGERRVPGAAAPEQPQLVPQLDRVGIGVAEAAEDVGGDGPHPPEALDRVRVQSRPCSASRWGCRAAAGGDPSAERRTPRCARRAGRRATGCCDRRDRGRGRSRAW